MNFEKVAPYLTEPLVLIGFFLFLAFTFTRALVVNRTIPPLPPGRGYQILRSILLYGFVIGILLIVLGFGLKFWQIHTAEALRHEETALREEQLRVTERMAVRGEEERARRDRTEKAAKAQVERNTVGLLRGELATNLATASELQKGTISILGVFDVLTKVTRTKGHRILNALFPAENLQRTDVNAVVLAEQAMARLGEENLQQNELETRRFAEAAAVIVGTIDRTTSTVQSLADAKGTRYRVRSEIWDSNQPVLREISAVSVPKFQEAYGAMRLLRANYEVVVGRTVEYMSALKDFLASPGHVINKQTLARVLVAERLAWQVIAAYSEQLIASVAKLQFLQRQLDPLALPGAVPSATT